MEMDRGSHLARTGLHTLGSSLGSLCGFRNVFLSSYRNYKTLVSIWQDISCIQIFNNNVPGLGILLQFEKQTQRRHGNVRTRL